MLSFNYKNKEDFIEEIYNGNFQDAIYEYLKDKEAELIYFKKRMHHVIMMMMLQKKYF